MIRIFVYHKDLPYGRAEIADLEQKLKQKSQLLEEEGKRENYLMIQLHRIGRNQIV